MQDKTDNYLPHFLPCHPPERVEALRPLCLFPWRSPRTDRHLPFETAIAKNRTVPAAEQPDAVTIPSINSILNRRVLWKAYSPILKRFLKIS